MKIYMVRGIANVEVNPGNFEDLHYFYGVFSSKIKAEKIANKIREHLTENDGQEEIFVRELTLDNPTDDYFMEIMN